MAGIQNEVVIHGSREKVFNLVNMGRFWPEWLVPTRAVGGVTETTFEVGDHVYEWVCTPAGTHELAWTVVEVDRPRYAKLQLEGGTSLAYTFEEHPDGTLFRRVVELGSENSKLDPPEALRLLGDADLAQACLQNLKPLVEGILWREGKGPVLSGSYSPG
jgi:hypothetical protein